MDEILKGSRVAIIKNFSKQIVEVYIFNQLKVDSVISNLHDIEVCQLGGGCETYRVSGGVKPSFTLDRKTYEMLRTEIARVEKLNNDIELIQKDEELKNIK